MNNQINDFLFAVWMSSCNISKFQQLRKVVWFLISIALQTFGCFILLSYSITCMRYYIFRTYIQEVVTTFQKASVTQGTALKTSSSHTTERPPDYDDVNTWYDDIILANHWSRYHQILMMSSHEMMTSLSDNMTLRFQCAHVIFT